VRVNTVAGEARAGGELPPRVALVPKGAAVPEIVVLWTARAQATELKIARSLDGGRTFGRPAALQSAGAAGNRGWAALAVDPTGTAHAVWLDHRAQAAGAGMAHEHGGTAAAATSTTGPVDPVAAAQGSSLYYASSRARTVERNVVRGVCYCCKTALAAGPDGALYAAWRHVYAGNIRDIAFSVSKDGGASFSSPARVSQDGWAINGCPEDGPAVAVGADGTVHVVWPTVVEGSAGPRGALFFASTRDGRTFTPRARIPTLDSPKPSHPQIVVDRNGRIAVAWDEVVGGRRVASAREVRPAAGRPPTFGAIVMLYADGPAMYPVLAATGDGLVAVWTTGGESSIVQSRVMRLP
jgi:hypothetical protein